MQLASIIFGDDNGGCAVEISPTLPFVPTSILSSIEIPATSTATTVHSAGSLRVQNFFEAALGANIFDGEGP